MTTGVLRFARTCIKPALLNVRPTLLVRFLEISRAVVRTCSRRYRVILDRSTGREKETITKARDTPDNAGAFLIW